MKHFPIYVLMVISLSIVTTVRAREKTHIIVVFDGSGQLLFQRNSIPVS
jgi:hypothetical protein